MNAAPEDHSELVVALVTAPQKEAPELARALVERRVAACVNVVDQLRSFYRWEGKIQDDAEALLIIKTRREDFSRLEAAVVDLHSYSVPEVIALPVIAGHEPYCRWVVENL